jgi:lipopolysaccharide transport system ATP-binding protein
MSDIAIKLENISKRYRLGTVGTNSMKADIQAWWYRLQGKEDQTLKIGHENSLADTGGEHVWALRDINFEVKKGEILGIIGKNGAGKSTLLKLLSRVTGPSTGQIKINGRIASLLEVGTGFHGELTGRENIFLNGSILGMTKREIQRQLEEIVEFAGIAKYIDTPVKRYSSGMYVRLGFAVAAHLNPDILIVDEVLAVGDAEFQKKAIGKMKEVSQGGGRTVLFVSHNMTSVKALCTSAILLKNGQVSQTGETSEIISSYLKNNISNVSSVKWGVEDALGTDKIKILSAFIQKNGDILYMSSDFSINFKIKFEEDTEGFATTYHLINEYENTIFGSSSGLFQTNFKAGEYLFSCKIPSDLMNSGTYSINLLLVQKTKVISYNKSIIGFSIQDNTIRNGWYGKLAGVVRPKLNWTIK